MRQNQKQKTGVLATVKSVIDHSLTAWLILAVSLVFTLVAWLLSNQYIENRAEDRFAFRMMQVREQISDRMLKYEQLLRSSVGLFVSSDHVSRNEWKTYIANCELKENFGGVQGIGYARVIHPTDPKALQSIQSNRKAFVNGILPSSSWSRSTGETDVLLVSTCTLSPSAGKLWTEPLIPENPLCPAW